MREVCGYGACARLMWPAVVVLARARTCAPCNLAELGGLKSEMLVRKLSDAARCPGSCVPEDALTIDGGTSYDPDDAVSWLRTKRNWTVMAFEPMPKNCGPARRAFATFKDRASLHCKALHSIP